VNDLILTLDYEIFGNAAGDVQRDMVEPTSRVLSICERHGAKMTIMFEVGEFWAFEQHHTQLRKDLTYSPSEKMRKQMVGAVRRGHDVQLHLHPQWIGAQYDKGVWRLRASCWRLADLPDGLGSEEQVTSITGTLYRGKHTLEEMIKPVKPDYDCVCFRAGGFYAQPSRDIIRAMKVVGLKADSSVVKGHRSTLPFPVDYSHVQTDKTVWWTSDTRLTEEGVPGENIIELSVSSRMEPYWKNFKKTKLRAALKRRRIERASSGNHAGGTRISSVPASSTVLKNLFRKRASTFDFCKLSCNDMLRRVEELADYREQPIVVIGHSKDFINDRQFDKFLAALKDHNVTFRAMSEYVHDTLSMSGISRSIEMGAT
jgi:hypothetical protein